MRYSHIQETYGESSSEMLVSVYETTWHHNQEDHNENLLP